MKTFQIITDSSCDLPQELADKLELLVLPLHFTIGGKTYANYLDGREIGFHDFFERIRQGEAASTSAVNPESFREAMEKTLQQGLDILFIGFSLAGVVGPLIMQKIFSEFASYRPSFPIAIVFALIGIALTFLYRAVNRKLAQKSA